MTRAGNERLPLGRALAPLGLGLVVAMACGGPQKQTGAGAVCFRTDDCRPGYACVPEAAGSSKRVCSTDLTLIVSTVDGAPPSAVGDAGASSDGVPAIGGDASTAGGTANAGAATGGGLSGGGSAGAAAGGAAASNAGAGAGSGG